MISLQKFWEKEQCPIVNGIIFANGAVMPIEMDSTKRGAGDRRSVLAGAETSLDQLEALGHLSFSFYTEMGEVVDASHSLKAVCGGGGMGGDGFVALLRYPSSQLEWVAFFDFANPFTNIKFSDDRIEAHNNLGETWSFPIDAPEKISIQAR
jgi:hypothetical protein